jgi:2-polyprenyl-6-methoxyphenol hydroxylase-like FAD-dependent oxidoreductase
MPDNLRALKELGVDIPLHAGFPFRGVRFVSAESTAVGDFPNEIALGVRRPVLHKLLTERAEKLGVNLRWGAKGLRLIGAGLHVNRELIKPKLIVGADGQRSLIRRLRRPGWSLA